MKQIVLLILSLSTIGCTSSSSYQADRPPQERDTYEGVGSIDQFMKDSAHALDYELDQKCNSSKISLMKAKADKNPTDIEKFSDAVKSYCRGNPI